MEQCSQSEIRPDYINGAISPEVEEEICWYIKAAIKTRDILDSLDDEDQPVLFEVDESFAKEHLYGIDELEHYIGVNTELPVSVPKETLRVLLEAGIINRLEEANEAAQDVKSLANVEEGNYLIEKVFWSESDTLLYAGVGFTEWWHMPLKEKWVRLAEHSMDFDYVLGCPNHYRYNLSWALGKHDPEAYKQFEPTINISKFLGREEEQTEANFVSFKQVVLDALNAVRHKMASATERAIDIGETVISPTPS